MNLTLSTCFVIVHDPDPALAFYRDTLGLELRNDVAKGDFRWITVGAASQPGVGIVLTNYLNGSPADSDAVAALVTFGILGAFGFGGPRPIGIVLILAAFGLLRRLFFRRRAGGCGPRGRRRY